MQIRKAFEKDLESITNLFLQEYSKPPYNETWDLKQAQKRIKGHHASGAQIYVSEHNQKIIGFLIFNRGVFWGGERRYVEEVVVDAEYQRQGVGKELMKTVENDCDHQKETQIYLLSKRGTNAFLFYDGLNFKENGWVLLEKRIDNKP